MKSLIALLLIGLHAFSEAAYEFSTGFPSGGTAAAPGHPTINYTLGTSGYGAANGGSQGATCSGKAQFKWTWQGAHAPPETVVLKVTSNAWVIGSGGSCSDGLGHPFVPNLPGPGTPPGGNSSGTEYFIRNDPGQTITYDITPFATTPSGAAGVTISIQVLSVVVVNTGTIAYIDADHALIGQHVISSIGASGLQLSNYDWTLTGASAFAHSVDWGTGDPPSKHQ